MKNFITFCCIFFTAFFMQSQNLTIDELALLRKKSFGNLEETLSSKNWVYIEGQEAEEGSMESATFAFNKKEYDDSAQAFLKFIYDNSENEELCSHRIVLHFFTKEKYNSYINRLKAIGCELIKSQIEDGVINKIYQGKTTTFKLSIVAEKDDFGTTKTRYQLFVISNADYFIFFDDDSSLRELLEKQIEEDNKKN